MSNGIKIPVVIPWSLVGAAALALAFMYRDVQHIRASMVSVERIARCESDIASLKEEDREIDERIKTLWRVRGVREEPR